MDFQHDQAKHTSSMAVTMTCTYTPIRHNIMSADRWSEYCWMVGYIREQVNKVVQTDVLDLTAALLGVPSLQWSISIKSPRKEQWTSKRIMGGLKITEGNKGWPVWSCPRDELKLQKSCDRQVSEFTVNHKSLHMGLQTGQGARADPRPPLKVPTMGRWALELDNGKMEDALGNVLLGMLGRWLNVVPDWCIRTIHVVARIAFSNCLCSSKILKVSVCWDFLARENP